MNTIKSIIGILALLCIQQQAFSQKGPNKCKIKTSPKEIVWDFSTGTLSTEPCCIAKGTNLPIRIENINQTLFDVVIDDKFRSFNTEPFDIIDFAKMQDDLNKAEAVVATFNKKSDDNNTQLESIQNMLDPTKKIIECGVCLNKILRQELTHKKAKARLKECTEDEDLTIYLNDLQQKALNNNTEILKTNNKALTQTYQAINQTIVDVDLKKAIEQIELLYAKINDPQTFEFATSIPIEAASELALEIKITPKDGVQLKGQTIPLQFPIKGIKISFSPGLFVNYFPNSKTHYLEDLRTAPDSVFIRGTFDDKSLIPSIGALVHVSFGGCKDYDFAISAGASTRLETGTMRWHLGGSALLGKQRRFVLSLGLTLGQGIRELDQNYSLDHPYLRADLVDKTLTTTVPHLGFFLGFSYNLPVQKKS